MLIAKAKKETSPFATALTESTFLYSTFTNGTVLTEQERNALTAVGYMGLRVLQSYFAPTLALGSFRGEFIHRFGAIPSPGEDFLHLAFRVVLSCVAKKTTGNLVVIFLAIDELNTQVESSLGIEELSTDPGYKAFSATLKIIMSIMNSDFESEGKRLVLIPIYSGTALRPIDKFFPDSSQALLSQIRLEPLSFDDSFALVKAFFAKYLPGSQVDQNHIHDVLLTGGHPRSLDYLLSDIQQNDINQVARRARVLAKLGDKYHNLVQNNDMEIFKRTILRTNQGPQLDPVVLNGMQMGLCYQVGQHLEIPFFLGFLSVKQQPLTSTIRRGLTFFLVNDPVIKDFRRFEVACTLAEVCRLRAFTIGLPPGTISEIPLKEYLAGSVFKFEGEAFETIKICLPVGEIGLVVSSHLVAADQSEPKLKSESYKVDDPKSKAAQEPRRNKEPKEKPKSEVSPVLVDLSTEYCVREHNTNVLDFSKPVAVVQGNSVSAGDSFIVLKGTYAPQKGKDREDCLLIFQFQFKHTTKSSKHESMNEETVVDEKNKALKWMKSKPFGEFLASAGDLDKVPRFLIFGLITNSTLKKSAGGFKPVEGAFVVGEGQFRSRYSMLFSSPLLSPFYNLQNSDVAQTLKRLHSSLDLDNDPDGHPKKTKTDEVASTSSTSSISAPPAASNWNGKGKGKAKAKVEEGD